MPIAFSLLSALILLSAVWVVVLPNLFRAALSLGLVLLGVAGLFILLEADFLAFVQILVYVGAVLTLVIFAIMLTSTVERETSAPASRQRGPAALVALALFAILAYTTRIVPTALEPPAAVPLASLASLGQQLVTVLVLPFEVISLVFVAAMVGAIALVARRSPPQA